MAIEPEGVILLNCAERVLTSTASVYVSQTSSDTWMTWPTGTSFCSLGINSTGSRFMVGAFCFVPACHKPVPQGTYIGWVSTNQMYYTPRVPACRPWTIDCYPLEES